MIPSPTSASTSSRLLQRSRDKRPPGSPARGVGAGGQHVQRQPPRAAHILGRARTPPGHTPRIRHSRLCGQGLLHGQLVSPAVTEVVDVAHPVALPNQAKQLDPCLVGNRHEVQPARGLTRLPIQRPRDGDEDTDGPDMITWKARSPPQLFRGLRLRRSKVRATANSR
jgi:hypothetical protein